MNDDGDITREARLYGIAELARRAGVTREFFRSWSICFEDDWTTIYVEPGSKKCLRFRNSISRIGNAPSKHILRSSRAGWIHTPAEPLRSLIPHFVIPFSQGQRESRAPLFTPVNGDRVDCALDLPVAALLTMSRFEEMVVDERDAHGRFSASKSLAVRENFLNRPVIDELGLAMEEALHCLLPNWPPSKRKLHVKLSHDIDSIGIPFNFREAVGHAIRRFHPGGFLKDVLAGVSDVQPFYLGLVETIASLSLDRGLDSAVYWKAGGSTLYDTGYDSRHPKVREVISRLAERGIENGVHPGYETFESRDRLKCELGILREALGGEFLGGRQHYLRWSPNTWLDWEACRLAYDSSVGFADRVGFRAGTCFPYRPWALAENRRLDLIEIPLVVMDCSLIQYMGLTLEESLAAMEECIARTRLVGGVFTLLWHNTTLADPAYGNVYQQILDELAGTEGFDGRIPPESLW